MMVVGVHWFRAVSLLAVCGVACSNEQTVIPGNPCVVNSDCNGPLVCTYGLCHEACRQNGDCPAEQRCVWSAGTVTPGDRARVCLLPDIASCAQNSQCTPDLVCGRDLQCRNECEGNRDCADDQDLCLEAGSNGERLCVDPEAHVNGVIIDRVNAGSRRDGGPSDASVPDGSPPTDAGSDAIDGGGAGDSVPDGSPPTDAGSDAIDGGGAGDEVEPNDAFADANPYLTGTKVQGCICTKDDRDWYTFSVPPNDAAGGYFTASITDVGDGAIFASLYSASDRGLLARIQTLERGQSRFFYFAGAPGQTYQLEVLRTGLGGYTPFDYTLAADYVRVNDPFEPNDTRDEPAPLELGTTVEPYFFTGFRQGSMASSEYEDWFSVGLAAGPTTVDLDDVPVTLRLRFLVYDDTFAALRVTDNTAPGLGAEVHGSFTIATPGTYRVVIQSMTSVPDAADLGALPPEHFTRPYRLTVAQ